MFLRTGFGDIQSQTATTCQLALSAALANPFANSLAWQTAFGPDCLATAYQGLVYGGAAPSTAPAASGTSTPLTSDQINASTADQVEQALATSQNLNSTAAQQAAIQAAINSGYNPDSSIPTVNFTIPGLNLDLNLPSNVLMIGGLILGGLVLWSLAKR